MFVYYPFCSVTKTIIKFTTVQLIFPVLKFTTLACLFNKATVNIRTIYQRNFKSAIGHYLSFVHPIRLFMDQSFITAILEILWNGERYGYSYGADRYRLYCIMEKR
jgi:hypothetical protein